MKTKNNQTVKTGMMVGAILGGLAFLVFGIIPGFEYSGLMVLALLSKITGDPLEMTLGIRMIVMLGVLVGSLCLATLAIVAGSVAGTGSAYVVNAISPVGTPQVK